MIKVTGIAGAEQHLLTLLPGLRQRGVDARLLALVEPGHPVDELAAVAAEVDLPFARMVIHSNADIGLTSRLRQYIRAEQPEMVHTHLLHADLYGIPAARLAGVRCVLSSRHNDDAFRRKTHWRAIHRVQWRMIDAGIAISDAIRQFCVDVEGASPKQIQTIHYGLTPSAMDDPVPRPSLRESLKLPADALLIGMVGRLIEQKGMRYGLEAFARVCGAFPSAHLVIAGDGVLRAELEGVAAALGIAERTHFLGWRTDVNQLMGAFDVFLMPSLWEGFGLVLLEAMARSLPVLASRVSAIPEIVVDGETGLLAPPRDVGALETGLRSLLSNAGMRQRMGSAGAERLHSAFGADKMIDATLRLYEQTLLPHQP
ncbi:MAG: glycosyltransferase family 4 protein [Anaerolineae bacterium]